MSDLRDLLIDLRIELRHLKPDFQKTPLRHRVDEAVSMLGRLPDATLEGLLRMSGKGSPASSPVRNDDAVWREVVADLRGRHPAVFDLIQREVDVRLGHVPAEPAAGAAATSETVSAPLLEAAEPIVVQVAPAAAEPEGDVPTEDILRLVAEGVRGLSEPQREWCMGEAMVVLEFRLSPQELLGRGDQVLARVILTGAID